MEQRQDASETPPADAVDDASSTATEGGESVLDRYFWPLFAAVFVLAAGAGVGITYLQYDRVAQAVEAVPYTDRAAQVAAALPYVGKSTQEDTRREYGAFAKLDGLIVNPAGSGGNRYLALSLAFEMASAQGKQDLEEKQIVVKDAVLNLLSKRTVDELSDPDRRDVLKKALREETNVILGEGTVRRIYFTEFVLQ